MSHKIKKFKKRVVQKYALALGIIALLSTIAFYALISALKEADSTAYIVNISGKQRMLSQHIALNIHRIHIHTIKNEHHDPYILKMLKSTLHQYTKEMLSANSTLSSGLLPDGEKTILSPTIYNMYFGEMNLVKRVEEYTTVAEKILQNPEHHNIDSTLRMIDNQSEQLLKDLHRVVQQYQIEGEATLSQIENMEITIWAFTLFVLLLEVIFIFQPMAHQILKLSDDNTQTLRNLENLVEVRTMHLEKANQKLFALASHDPLTGLRNRLNLEKDIENSINHYALHHAPYALLMFDIDWFKKVNDTHGHDIGDLVLTEIAKILQHSVREEDRVYRAGGEEFVVLLNRVTYEDTCHIAEKIRSQVNKHEFICNGIHLTQTISGGIYHSSLAKANSVKSLLKLVDDALYEAKTAGRNQIKEIQKGV